MKTPSIKPILPSIHSFEEFEVLKQNIKFFENAAKEMMHRHHLPEASLTLFSEGTNIVFAYGEHQVIKIFPPCHFNQFHSDQLALKHLQGKLSVKTPALEYEGEINGWPYIIMTKLEGTLLETLWETMNHENKLVILCELGALIREVHSLPTDGLEEIDCHWPQFIKKQIDHCVERHRSTGLPSELVLQIPSYLESIHELITPIKKSVLLTGEYTPMNFLVKQVDGVWHIDGLIDFGDAMLGLPEYDLLGPGAFLIQGDKTLLRAFLTAYGYSSDMLTKTLSAQLTGLMLLHQYSNLNVQIRVDSWREKVSSIADLQNLVWGL